ncbi:MAG: beta-ketoacyl synthase N-terminal-like domain-containing protein [Candidatus Cyclobacteriaceae bacterium M2_1C_046]
MKVYTVADNIISPLGFDTKSNFNALVSGKSGIKKLKRPDLSSDELYVAAIDKAEISERFNFAGLRGFSFLEMLMILSIHDVLDPVKDKINLNKLLLVVSTTKGNIDQIEEENKASLPSLAKKINAYFNLPHDPLVISNACISGTSAMIVGKKLIDSESYDHVLVCGADILSEFVISGFNSLKAISNLPCKPYDKSRTGITLGEGCGTVLLSNDPELCIERNSLAEIAGSGQANDANHISGPSRTGKGLKISVEKAFKQARVANSEIGYINAHGTATPFNDEMESVAFKDLKLSDKPLNSLKGYFGHTLGAAGVIESILTIWQMNNHTVVKSPGFENQGTTNNLNVVRSNIELKKDYVLKTISGFGGCNASIIFRRWN